MKRILVLVGIAAVLAGARLASAATHDVSIGDNVFSPETITVAVGDTVHWANGGDRDHTVTADGGSFDSGSLSTGQTFDHTFSTAGSFPYHCEFHGSSGGGGMSGTVIVQAPTPTGSPSGVATTPATPAGSQAGADELADTGARWLPIALAGVAFVLGGSTLLRARRSAGR